MNHAVALAVSVIAAIVTTFGIYVIRKYESWGKKSITYFMCFAAGVLISVSFVHIIPVSIAMNSDAPVFLLIGYLFFHLVNRFLNLYVCGRQNEISNSIGLLTLMAIGFHSLIDGVIYSITFTTSIFTGLLAATGMVLHEFPEGVITFLLLTKSGYDKKTSTLYAFLATAITTPIGTLISLPFIGMVDKSTLGLLLSFSAGALVYVGATHLLPESEKESKKYSLLALGAGVLVATLIVMSKS